MSEPTLFPEPEAKPLPETFVLPMGVLPERIRHDRLADNRLAQELVGMLFEHRWASVELANRLRAEGDNDRANEWTANAAACNRLLKYLLAEASA